MAEPATDAQHRDGTPPPGCFEEAVGTLAQASHHAPDTANLFDVFAGRGTLVDTDFEGRTLTFSADGTSETIPFAISGFDAELVRAGGWLDYADTNY